MDVLYSECGVSESCYRHCPGATCNRDEADYSAIISTNQETDVTFTIGGFVPDNQVLNTQYYKRF
jgi:hypothetical protein